MKTVNVKNTVCDIVSNSILNKSLVALRVEPSILSVE